MCPGGERSPRGRCVCAAVYYMNPVPPEAESVRAPVLSVRDGGGGRE